MIEAPPPTSEPSPTTTPATMRPSTIEVPSVPALKLTKPSCMTVVPSARCAPRRTRSPSAMRTPVGHDVVEHPRELVDAVHADAPAGGHAAAPAGLLEAGHGARPGGGPHHVGQLAEDAVHRDGARGDEPVAEQVQAQPGVLGRGRRGLQVLDDDRADLAGHPAGGVGADELVQVGGRAAAGRRRARGPGNHTSRTAPRRRPGSTRPWPQALPVTGTGASVTVLDSTRDGRRRPGLGSDRGPRAEPVRRAADRGARPAARRAPAHRRAGGRAPPELPAGRADRGGRTERRARAVEPPRLLLRPLRAARRRRPAAARRPPRAAAPGRGPHAAPRRDGRVAGRGGAQAVAARPGRLGRGERRLPARAARPAAPRGPPAGQRDAGHLRGAVALLGVERQPQRPAAAGAARRPRRGRRRRPRGPGEDLGPRRARPARRPGPRPRRGRAAAGREAAADARHRPREGTQDAERARPRRPGR